MSLLRNLGLFFSELGVLFLFTLEPHEEITGLLYTREPSYFNIYPVSACKFLAHMSEGWKSFHLNQFKSLVKDLLANLFAALTFEEKIPTHLVV